MADMQHPKQLKAGNNHVDNRREYKMVIASKDTLDYLYACGECWTLVDMKDNFCWNCATNIELSLYGYEDVTTATSSDSKPPQAKGERS